MNDSNRETCPCQKAACRCAQAKVDPCDCDNCGGGPACDCGEACPCGAAE